MATNTTTVSRGPRAVLEQNHHQRFADAALAQPGTLTDVLPEDTMREVFGYLTPQNLVTASLVCKVWYSFANEGSQWKRFVTFYDQSFWNQCIDTTGLDFTGDSVSWAKFKSSVITLSKVPTEGTPKERSDDIVVLSLPSHLSVDVLEQRTKAATRHPMGFRSNSLNDTDKNNLTTRATVVFLKKFVVVGSRDQSYANQETLLKGYKCVMPSVLSAASLVFLTHIDSGVRLLSDDPWTYTRCEGKKVLGGFAPGGPNVYDFIFDFGFNGVLAQR